MAVVLITEVILTEQQEVPVRQRQKRLYDSPKRNGAETVEARVSAEFVMEQVGCIELVSATMVIVLHALIIAVAVLHAMVEVNGMNNMNQTNISGSRADIRRPRLPATFPPYMVVR